MSDNTSIYIRYNKKNAVFVVYHAQWGDEEETAEAESFGTQFHALRHAVQMYNNLKKEFRAPEYGITPLYDPLNLTDAEQSTLEEWIGVP